VAKGVLVSNFNPYSSVVSVVEDLIKFTVSSSFDGKAWVAPYPVDGRVG
jgi:hypothetical protein